MKLIAINNIRPIRMMWEEKKIHYLCQLHILHAMTCHKKILLCNQLPRKIVISVDFCSSLGKKRLPEIITASQPQSCKIALTIIFQLQSKWSYLQFNCQLWQPRYIMLLQIPLLARWMTRLQDPNKLDMNGH